MKNQFIELTSSELEEETSSSPSIYQPDEEMLKNGYDWDSSGL